MSENKYSRESLWYKDAIIYELHVKAFRDSNEDGIGDMQGLLEKLDYLEDLGITTIWLLPFYPSPLRDDGYDIADYFNIRESYGDIKTFKKLVKEAHKRGLQVITELVINHTSDQHPWFQRARRAKPGSIHRDYYVWSDDPNKFKDVRIIFTDTEPSNWTWDPVAKSYYWHRFFSHQPDLNYDNPEVQKEIFKIIDFWLNMGVDGFRLDAIPYLFQREGTNCENLPETHEFLKTLRAYVDSKYDNVLLLAEANMWPEEAASYFGKGDECQMNYHFPIMPRLFMAVRMEDRYPVTDIIDQTPEIPPNCQWGIFLRNHDELTLEMVTDEERDYMYKVYTRDPQAKINVGIRHRLAPLLNNNRKKIELMNILLFSLPGTPILYYGDEIGMGDNYYLGDRDGVRTPMQWSADRNAGFSEVNPQKLYLPVIIDPEFKYESINVETQQLNSSSLLWWMKRVMAKRKQFKAFGRGDIKFLTPANPKVLAFTRTFEDETILVVVNLSRFAQPALLDLQEFENHTPIEVFNQNVFPTITSMPYLFTLGPHAYFWFQLHKVSERSEELDSITAGVSVASMEAFANPKNKQLEKVLPPYLKKRHWFTAKSRKIKYLGVKNFVEFPLKGHKCGVFIIEIEYDEGLPELYQIPLVFIPDKRESEITQLDKTGIIAKAKIGGNQGLLVDALYLHLFRDQLLEYLLKNNKIKEKNGQSLVFSRIRKKSDLPEVQGTLKSTLFTADQTNTSIMYGSSYYFKLFRKLDNLVNPEFEIVDFFNKRTKFSNVPKLLGIYDFEGPKKAHTTLGMVQELVNNQGDAWKYFQDSAGRFFERLMVISKPESIEKVKGEEFEIIHFHELTEEWQSLLGGDFVEMVSLLGKRTGEMHLALASKPGMKGFEPELFSLHYQRSLFSALQSLTRSAFQILQQSVSSLPEDDQKIAKEVLALKSDVLNRFKMIYSEKIDAMKIRNHGDFHLGQVLWTGKDFIFIDFEGEPLLAFSERRIKRSPLRDLAGMIRSFHYVIYSTYFTNNSPHLKQEGFESIVDDYYRLVSKFYIRSYLESVGENNFLPGKKNQFEILLQTFLLEKAVYELKFDLQKRPDWARIPMQGIKYLMAQKI